MSTVLVIDDEPAILELFAIYLSDEDLKIVTAENAKTAVSLLDRFQPDLIITDLIMPDKEGIETVRQVKAQYPDIKIITMSGVANHMYLEMSTQLGADLAITKPIDFTNLKTQMANLLH